MPNMKNAIKKVRVISKKKENNNEYRSSMRTAIKSVRSAIDAKDKDKANENLKVAIKKIDKATAKGIIHKNASGRSKSRLTKKVNEME